ncbi:amino-acid n-acetyltransferase subunit [Moniliophthora roreri MCA 2997]|uniref:Amino-acid n-acetyltransferase subunit n=1 Tax=Moniliophthora roreri (strain MCA 2997) TaxID=1381753 RepID=V2WUE5_MONRO|nr:amino-acid n-acetyltransferase subunit [Moniliophthora roreri MCA 2997]
MYSMELDLPELPGGDSFHDVTSLFTDAAADMQQGEMIMIDGFQLQDAMSAIEIGEPRLDTGMKLGSEPFDPLALLLPEELCWILDRSFSYEMEWHSANSLSHTVFTLLYVHHLGTIDPDMLPYAIDADPARPLGLITVVLRAFVCAMLKCCDLSWRELTKGGLHDTEDWQSEKCEVSLLEGWPVNAALARLEDAIKWLWSTPKVPKTWYKALCDRLLFRKTILELMEHDIYHDKERFRHLLRDARRYLDEIRSQTSIPEPSQDSPARKAFDPYIAGRLNTFLPIRVVELPAIEDSWSAWNNFLDGWEETLVLSDTKEITSWEVVGNLRVWVPSPPLRAAYIRSSTQTTFYDGLQILNDYPTTWLVKRFFLETLGVNYTIFAQYWGGPSSPRLVEVERTLIRTLIPHIRGLWFNPPRRRRFLSASLLDWHNIYDTLTIISEDLDRSEMHPSSFIVTKMPYAALLWRLSIVREVVLSGFQLELYSSTERPFAYWYASQVIDGYLHTLDMVMGLAPSGSSTEKEMKFQQVFLTALNSMCMAMFSILYTIPSRASWAAFRGITMRRHKWAFRVEYEDYENPPIAHPHLESYLADLYEMDDDEWFSPSDSFGFAKGLLESLLGNRDAGGWAGHWKEERMQVVRGLISACTELGGLSRRPRDAGDATLQPEGYVDVTRLLKWKIRISTSPWFPSLA